MQELSFGFNNYTGLIMKSVSWQSLGVLLLLQLTLETTTATKELCDGAENVGRLRSHPERCDWFVECRKGSAYTGQCGPTLHFNPDKGVCDFPHLSHCPATKMKGTVETNSEATLPLEHSVPVDTSSPAVDMSSPAYDAPDLNLSTSAPTSSDDKAKLSNVDNDQLSLTSSTQSNSHSDAKRTPPVESIYGVNPLSGNSKSERTPLSFKSNYGHHRSAPIHSGYENRPQPENYGTQSSASSQFEYDNKPLPAYSVFEHRRVALHDSNQDIQSAHSEDKPVPAHQASDLKSLSSHSSNQRPLAEGADSSEQKSRSTHSSTKYRPLPSDSVTTKPADTGRFFNSEDKTLTVYSESEERLSLAYPRPEKVQSPPSFVQHKQLPNAISSEDTLAYSGSPQQRPFPAYLDSEMGQAATYSENHRQLFEHRNSNFVQRPAYSGPKYSGSEVRTLQENPRLDRRPVDVYSENEKTTFSKTEEQRPFPAYLENQRPANHESENIQIPPSNGSEARPLLDYPPSVVGQFSAYSESKERPVPAYSVIHRPLPANGNPGERPISTFEEKQLPAYTGNGSEQRPLPAYAGDRSDQRPLPSATGDRSEQRLLPSAAGDRSDQRPLPSAAGDRSDQRPLPSATGDRSDQRPSPTYTGDRSDQRPLSAYGGNGSEQRPLLSVTDDRSDQRPFPAYTGAELDQRPLPAYAGDRSELRPLPAYTGDRSEQRPLPAYTGAGSQQRPMPAYYSRPEQRPSHTIHHETEGKQRPLPALHRVSQREQLIEHNNSESRPLPVNPMSRQRPLRIPTYEGTAEPSLPVHARPLPMFPVSNERSSYATSQSQEKASVASSLDEGKLPLTHIYPVDRSAHPSASSHDRTRPLFPVESNKTANRQLYQETVYGFPGKSREIFSEPSDIDVKEFRKFFSSAIKRAKKTMEKQLLHESTLMEQMRGVVDSPAFSHVAEFMNSNLYARSLAESAITMLEAIRIIGKKFAMPSDRVLQTMRNMRLTEMLRPMQGHFHPDTALPSVADTDICPFPSTITCDGESLTFRAFDGLCNNLVAPIIGRMMTPFRRLLQPIYSDGIEEMRLSVTGDLLPSARFISFNTLPDLNRPHHDISMALVFFGQFVDHDITRTAISKIPMADGEMADVKCGNDGCQTASENDGMRSCWPIPVPDDDSDFAFNRCLKFVRSLEVPALDCQPGTREQLNQVTHWIDGSQLYGSSKNDSDSLRDLTNPGRGKMAMAEHPVANQKPLLPTQINGSLCEEVNKTFGCFRAGDSRVNENAGLGLFHILFIRQHNWVEEQLHLINPLWNGEQLFQETRKIVIASIQHIIFNEFLPLVVGPDSIKKYELDLLAEGYFTGYDPSVDARIPNEFVAAAFRFGHTLIQERFLRVDKQNHSDSSLRVSQTFRQPFHLYSQQNGGMDSLIRGLARNPSQQFDWFFTKQLSRSLFTDLPPHGLGHDLMSLNIQRGRDHGLPTYNDIRKFCGLNRAKSFDGLANEIHDSDFRSVLSKVYKHVDDIDLFIGGVSEDPADGAVVGPSFGCIIARSFQNLRKGDRFWYENKENGFNEDQLKEIRKITLARILCTNADAVDRIHPFVFLQPGKAPSYFRSPLANAFNTEIDCDQIPDIDLNLWRDDKNSTSLS